MLDSSLKRYLLYNSSKWIPKPTVELLDLLNCRLAIHIDICIPVAVDVWTICGYIGRFNVEKFKFVLKYLDVGLCLWSELTFHRKLDNGSDIVMDSTNYSIEGEEFTSPCSQT